MNMKQTCLSFGSNPIRDAISRIRFAPHSNHLLISSWDSVSFTSAMIADYGDNCVLKLCSNFESNVGVFLALQSLRLYDVDACKLTLEASDEYPLLDCCFADDSLAFSAATDGLLRRFIFALALAPFLFSFFFFFLKKNPAFEFQN